jgi:hypothetical protein
LNFGEGPKVNNELVHFSPWSLPPVMLSNSDLIWLSLILGRSKFLSVVFCVGLWLILFKERKRYAESEIFHERTQRKPVKAL